MSWNVVDAAGRPEKTVVGYREFKVEYCRGMGGDSGCFDKRKSLISINDKDSLEEQANDLLHEHFHGVAEVIGAFKGIADADVRDGVEEMVVRNYANAISEMSKRDPLTLHWILQGMGFYDALSAAFKRKK